MEMDGELRDLELVLLRRRTGNSASSFSPAGAVLLLRISQPPVGSDLTP